MSNYLITQSGRKINCNGVPHDVLCKRLFGFDLAAFLGREHQGVRVKIHGEHAAIEGYDVPNSQQQGKIRAILRQNDIFDLVTKFRGNYNHKSNFTKAIRSI